MVLVVVIAWCLGGEKADETGATAAAALLGRDERAEADEAATVQ